MTNEKVIELGRGYKVVYYETRMQPYTLWKAGEVVYFAKTLDEITKILNTGIRIAS